MKTKIRAEIAYWGAGFSVDLLGFPCFQDDGVYIPNVPFGLLHKAIALEVLRKPQLLTGNEIAFLRAQAEMTRSEGARKLGVTRRTLINWEENGDRPIKTMPLAHLGARCLFFGWVFGGLDAKLWKEKKVEPHPSNVSITLRFEALEGLRGLLKKTEQAAGFPAQIAKRRKRKTARTDAGISIAASGTGRVKAEKPLRKSANQ